MKKSIAIVCYSLLAVVILALATVGVAYYTKKDIYDGILSGNVELLFDRLDQTGGENSALAEYQRTLDANAQYDATASWGSEKNPYVISNVRHLYNLGELQKLGFFWNNYISDNYTNGVYNNGTTMPYFLVCTPEGEPACIDGTTFGRKISAIGTETYPFIGSVKGSFKTSPVPCVIKTVNGVVHQADTSAISNIEVIGNPADVDVGLFGHVRCLGDPTKLTDTDNDGTGDTFTGVVAELSNLLLYDVQVIVDSTAWDLITEFVDESMHDYAYDIPNEQLKAAIPHENHHIGILVGHISYTKVEFISVYYSNDTVTAIDLMDLNSKKTTNADGTETITYANYLSSCGIMGYLDNLNPDVTDAGISAGSGQSNGNITYSPIGGGGSLSGSLPGYVLAKDIYNNYGFVIDHEKSDATTTAYRQLNSNETYYIKNAYAPVYQTDEKGEFVFDESGKKIPTGEYEPLCQAWDPSDEYFLNLGDSAIQYYFYDDVFTFALSTQQDTIADTWTSVDLGNTERMQLDIGTYVGNKGDAGYAAGWDAVFDDDSFQAIVAFLDPITSDAELQEAIAPNGKNREIFITAGDGTTINLMSLFEQSKPGTSSEVEEKFTVPQGTQSILDENSETITNLRNLYQGYINDPDTFGDDERNAVFGDMADEYDTLAEMIAALNDLVILDVGRSSNPDELKKKYTIQADVVEDYQYFDSNGNAVTLVDVDGKMQVQDYYDYADCGYDGYFYYISSIQSHPGVAILKYTVYEHHWVDIRTGTDTRIDSGAVDWFDNDGEQLLTPSWFYGTDGTVEANTWNGEKTYTHSVNIDGVATSCTGVVIDMDKQSFYDTSNQAYAIGANLTKPVVDADGNSKYIDYFYSEVGSSTVLNASGSIVTLTDTTTESDGGITLSHDTNGNIGIFLKRYPMYSFSNGNDRKPEEGTTSMPDYDTYAYYMTMLELQYSYDGTTIGTYYPIANIPNALKNSPNYFKAEFATGWLFGSNRQEISPVIENTTSAATLIFNSDNTCTIRYTIGTVTRYIAYDDDNDLFIGTTQKSAATNLRLYASEGTQSISAGRVKMQPDVNNEIEDASKYTVDSYVLWPNVVEEATVSENGTITYIEGVRDDYTYSVVSIADLANAGWRDGSIGANTSDGKFDSDDLTHKFHMLEGISFGAEIDFGGFFGFDNIVGYQSGGFLIAPVGSDGYKANIPVGCVAFRIDDIEAGSPLKIRVIVAVPAYDFYDGEDPDSPSYTQYKHYLNVWQLDEAGNNPAQIFNADEAVVRFKLPKSFPFAADTTASAADYLTVNIPEVDVKPNTNNQTLVKPGETNYSCSLNGDKVLVAYEFVMDENLEDGIYILGMSGCNAEGEFVDTEHVPMEIVYFSSDYVASAGRDGTSGSQIGTIDFVYDYDKDANGQQATTTVTNADGTTSTANAVNVITVKETFESTDGGENYAYYYPSNVIMYFNNSKIKTQSETAVVYYDINDTRVNVRRWIDTTKLVAAGQVQGTASTMNFTVTAPNSDLITTNGGEYVKLVSYANKKDILDIEHKAEARATTQ